MNTFERLRQLPRQTEQKQQQLDRFVLFGGFILQFESPHEAFWLPELHKQTKTLARMTVGPLGIIESVRRLQASDKVAQIPQPEPAPDCWHSAEAGGPRRLTLPGIQEVISTYCESVTGEIDPLIANMPEPILAKFDEHVSRASELLAKLSPNPLDAN